MKFRAIALKIFAVASAIGLWWVATELFWSNNPVLSKIGPADSVPELFSIITSANGFGDIRASLGRLLSGLLIAFGIGIPLGLSFGFFRAFEDATTPIVNFLRMISPLAWAPIVIVAVGVGSAPVIFLISVTAVWPLAMGSAAGVKAITPGWKSVATSLGASKFESLRFVTAPAMRGHVLTASRLALGVAWIVLVPAEMLGVDSGLGYAILNARDQLNYSSLGGTVLLVGVIGFALDSLFRRALRTR